MLPYFFLRGTHENPSSAGPCGTDEQPLQHCAQTCCQHFELPFLPSSEMSINTPSALHSPNSCRFSPTQQPSALSPWPDIRKLAPAPSTLHHLAGSSPGFVQLRQVVFDAAFSWGTRWTDWSDREMKSLVSLLFERSQISGKLWFIRANSWGEIVLRHRCEIEVTYFNYRLEAAALNLKEYLAPTEQRLLERRKVRGLVVSAC